ncbi:MAG: glycosyltransferase, partial [Anaerolineae bacterium]|nr:glycosyltransferase [Anaerolineae bacterium]
KPLILSPHGTLTPETGRSGLKAAWDRLLSPAVARRFDHIIGLTEAESAEVQAIWPRFGRRRIPAAFSVIPNGVDPAEYENLSGRDSFRRWYGLGDAVVCLFMGRLHERKGAHKLVEAFQQANVPKTRLVIAGPDEGMLATIQSMADERVVITGYLDGAERLAALAAADMLALPAVGEGLPMVVLEAMAAGLPVIVSPECHLPEVAQYGAGLEIEPEVGALAEALRELLNNDNKRKQMGIMARQLVQERFTWDAVAEQLEAVYSRLLGA